MTAFIASTKQGFVELKALIGPSKDSFDEMKNMLKALIDGNETSRGRIDEIEKNVAALERSINTLVDGNQATKKKLEEIDNHLADVQADVCDKKKDHDLLGKSTAACMFPLPYPYSGKQEKCRDLYVQSRKDARKDDHGF